MVEDYAWRAKVIAYEPVDSVAGAARIGWTIGFYFSNPANTVR